MQARGLGSHPSGPPSTSPQEPASSCASDGEDRGVRVSRFTQTMVEEDERSWPGKQQDWTARTAGWGWTPRGQGQAFQGNRLPAWPLAPDLSPKLPAATLAATGQSRGEDSGGRQPVVSWLWAPQGTPDPPAARRHPAHRARPAAPPPYSQEICLQCRASLVVCRGLLPGASMVNAALPALRLCLRREEPLGMHCQSWERERAEGGL